MNQLDAKRVGHAEQGRCGQERIQPTQVLSDLSEQAGTTRQTGKQVSKVGAKPDIEPSLRDAFDRVQNRKRDDLARRKPATHRPCNVLQVIVYPTENADDKIQSGHRVCS
jgi:hypothetical protein